MNKKTILYIFLIFTIAIIMFIASNINYEEAVSVKDYHELGEETDLQVVGRISSISLDTLTVVDLKFPEKSITYELEGEEINLEEHAVGEIVLVEGYYDKNSNSMKAVNIREIEDERNIKHLDSEDTHVKISIVDYSKDMIFTIRLENNSNKTINYEDLYDEHFGYTLIYELNETIYSYEPVENFGQLKPEEVKEIEVILTPEIKSNTNTIKFMWAKKSLHDIEFETISESEEITFNF